jgi:hypothetical protein
VRPPPRRSSSLLRFGVAPALVLAACHPGSRSTAGATDSSITTAASAVASGHPYPSVSLRPPLPPPPGCKAVTVVGAPKITPFQLGAPPPNLPATVLEQTDLPDDIWVELADGERFVTKHPRSTRETSFSGPARVRSCVGNGEESWLASGKFESVASSGERPGPEEWVVTPEGVVRYGSAKLEVVVSAAGAADGGKTEIKVMAGYAYAWTGDQMGALKPPATPDPSMPHLDDAWTRIDGPRTLALSQKKADKPETAAQAAVDRCASTEKEAREMAAVVKAADASLHTSAPQQVVARRVAQAACDVAALRIGLLAPSPARDLLTTTLKGLVPTRRHGRGGPGPRPRP